MKYLTQQVKQPGENGYKKTIIQSRLFGLFAKKRTAKQNGSWTILDEVEELIIPKDLEAAFKTKANSKGFFLSLSKSVRKFQ